MNSEVQRFLESCKTNKALNTLEGLFKFFTKRQKVIAKWNAKAKLIYIADGAQCEEY